MLVVLVFTFAIQFAFSLPSIGQFLFLIQTFPLPVPPHHLAVYGTHGSHF